MPYFDSKGRTVFSPQNPKLEPLYSFLEQYHKTFSGSNFFEELLDTYEYLDQVFKNDEQVFHAWQCHSGCGHTTIMDKFLKGKRIYCGNCGHKTEMVYLGETSLSSTPVLPNNFTLRRKNK